MFPNTNLLPHLLDGRERKRAPLRDKRPLDEPLRLDALERLRVCVCVCPRVCVCVCPSVCVCVCVCAEQHATARTTALCTAKLRHDRGQDDVRVAKQTALL
jgi:hypothetical protein